MSRILLAWEMGGNLGHVSRLLPVARRLKTGGHSVVAAVRDAGAASALLGPANIPFVQSPYAVLRVNPREMPASYATLLDRNGWGNPLELWGLVQAWINLIRLCRTQLLVVDYAPTAILAGQICEIPIIAVGTGFEIPPSSVPLPPFTGFEEATHERALLDEARVLANANRVMKASGRPDLSSLSGFIQPSKAFFTTMAELDHYGSRPHADYVGPINDLGTEELFDLPAEVANCVFAYLRPEMASLGVILDSLQTCGRTVVCYAPGVPEETVKPFRSSRFYITSSPVPLVHLLPQAAVCLSYAPAGTVTSGLLSGVPQIMLPMHLEAQLTARRVEQLGAGICFPASQLSALGKAIQLLHHEPHFRNAATAFSHRYASYDLDVAIERITAGIETFL